MMDIIDYVENLLHIHDIDINKETIAFAFHDSVVLVSQNQDNDTLVAEMFLTDNVIGIPLNITEVIK